KDNPEKAFFFSAPVQARVLANDFTVRHTVKESKVPVVITSPAMRRILRPGSRLMKSLPFDAAVTKDNLIERINKGEVFPAPPKKVPPTDPSVQDLADSFTPQEVPPFIANLILNFPVIKWLFLILALFCLLLLFTLSLGWFFSFIFLLGAIVFGILFY